jgi:hypothetical protein
MLFGVGILIYNIKEDNTMKKIKTKKNFTVSLNRKMYNIIEEKFSNKSKYVEWLVYQDLLKNCDDGEIKNIIL